MCALVTGVQKCALPISRFAAWMFERRCFQPVLHGGMHDHAVHVVTLGTVERDVIDEETHGHRCIHRIGNAEFSEQPFAVGTEATARLTPDLAPALDVRFRSLEHPDAPGCTTRHEETASPSLRTAGELTPSGTG